MGTGAACGRSSEDLVPSASGKATDESAQSSSATDGETSTSGGATSTGTPDTGAFSSDTTSFVEDGASSMVAASDGQGGESTGSDALDPGSSTELAGGSTGFVASAAESEDSSTDSGANTDAGSAPTCDGVAACNDHGACVERVGGLLCDCEVDDFPLCELPLVREIGSSGDSRELILTNISADGSTIVGTHAPYGTPPEQPAVAVTWTLERGLESLALDPRGDNVAMGIATDNRTIVGYVKVTPYPDDWADVVWRDGVLEPRDPDEMFDSGGPRPTTPTAAEVEDMLDELGIVHWTVEYVNAISADGKVMFWLGHGPDRWKRWQLRLP